MTPTPDTLRDWIRRENTLARPQSAAVIDRNRREREQKRLAMLRGIAEKRAEARRGLGPDSGHENAAQSIRPPSYRKG